MNPALEYPSRNSRKYDVIISLLNAAFVLPLKLTTSFAMEVIDLSVMANAIKMRWELGIESSTYVWVLSLLG